MTDDAASDLEAAEYALEEAIRRLAPLLSGVDAALLSRWVLILNLADPDPDAEIQDVIEYHHDEHASISSLLGDLRFTTLAVEEHARAEIRGEP